MSPKAERGDPEVNEARSRQENVILAEGVSQGGARHIIRNQGAVREVENAKVGEAES